jgi:hypothetical protein
MNEEYFQFFVSEWSLTSMLAIDAFVTLVFKKGGTSNPYHLPAFVAVMERIITVDITNCQHTSRIINKS